MTSSHPIPEPVAPVHLPPERPNGGGTVYARPPAVPVDWFRRMPNGGQVNRSDAPAGDPQSGNPYAHIDENPDIPQRYVDVELPPLPEEDR